ncbi:hypothetical protein BASA81_006839 [Batrachochytrium salamandrivorans]|nr:hypothetical protein BASA81_006839 [Batrachochytrium salamandrivorans]
MFGSLRVDEQEEELEEDSLEQYSRKFGPEHWKTKGLRFLHNHKVVKLVVGLIFADIVLLVLSLVMESAHPGCAVIELHCHCKPVDVCHETCTPMSPEMAWILELINFMSSLILVVFLLEVSLHMACVGMRKFLLFDFAVLALSLGIESYVVYQSRRLESAQAITIPLLLLSRSWRLFRIGHSAYEDATRLANEDARAMRHEIILLKRQSNSNN